MILDPRAGTHFTGKIFVTPHALERAVEHFGIERGRAPMHVMDLLRKSALIDAQMTGEDGATHRLFAYKRIAFIVAAAEDTVITLYPQEATTNATITDNVAKVLMKVLRAAQRTEKRELHRLAIRKAELNVQRAELELRIVYANMNVVKRKLNEELAQVKAEINAVDAAAFDVKREKSTLAKGLCAYI